MKKVIRHSVFETNSSSVHSVTLKGLKDIENLECLASPIRIVPGEYGWSGPDVSGTLEKIAYLAAMILDYKYNWDEKNQKSYSDKERLAMLEYDPDWIRIQAAVRDRLDKEVEIVIPEGHNFYVDHQSCMSLEDFLGNRSLEDFLFDPSVVVELDNDNH